MKKNIILLTGDELRHKYFASFLASYPSINLKLTVHESNIKLKKNILYKKDKLIKKHVDLRNKEEIFSFKKFIKKNKKYNFISIKNGNINDEKVITCPTKVNEYVNTWENHVTSWYSFNKVPRLMIKYEDMLKDTKKLLYK